MRGAPTVLVLGGTSRLGTAAVPHLTEIGYRVVRHGHRSPGDVRADLTDRSEANRLLDDVRPDVILNLAAMTDVDECERRLGDAFLANTRSAEHVAAWMQRHGGVPIVQISTDQVYSGRGPHDESDARPVNAYGLTKYAGDRAVVHAGGTVLRTNYFGLGTVERPSLSDWLIYEFRRGTPIQLFTDILFSPLHVQTLVGLIGVVLQNPQRGVFNVGSADGMSKRDFGHAVARCLGLDPRNAIDATSDAVGHRAARPRDMRLDSSLFERTYGRRMPTLESEIARLRS